MKIGLVLCGGMAKGAYQIGVLRAIREFIPREDITTISCASVGVLNGYAFATDQLGLAETMWKSICQNDSRVFVGKLLKSSLLQQNIVGLYNPQMPLNTQFYCALMDATHRNVIYKELSAVEPRQHPIYLKASVAIPIYNRAVTIDKVQYYDGAIVDNIPIYPLGKLDLDYIICVYFDDVCYRFENASLDKKIIKISFPAEAILQQTVLFEPATIEAMIQRGYDRAMHVLKSVFFEGYDNLDYIYKTIAFTNRTNSASLRVTADVLATNLNKVLQRLTIRRIL